MKKLILTVGLPRSGKSTWAKKQNLPIVNPDSIRLALHGNAFTGEAERMVWTQAHYMVKALFLAGHDVVILDATNTTKKRRDEWKSKEWDTYFKVFKTPESICVERAFDDDSGLLIPIIRHMNENQEPLTEDEKPLVLITPLKYDTECLSTKDIKEALKDAVSETLKSQKRNLLMGHSRELYQRIEGKLASVRRINSRRYLV